MKTIFSIWILFSVALKMVSAQTNVSGGIYTNTTWTKANSPYIVTDTVVVFPGVTLTIEAGVIVKFSDNKVLESRQGKIYAIGTSIDSIIFKSNSPAPAPGVWSQIYINGGTLISQFEYCIFEYAKSAIYNHHLNGTQNTTDEVHINNSKFYNNVKGVSTIGNGGGFSKIANSIFINNYTGTYGAQIIVNSCNIINNQIGIYIEPFSFTYTYIDSSNINSNQFGITGNASTGASFYSIKNSIINSNTIAGIVQGGYPSYIDTILYCEIKNNAFGILDSFGSGLLMQYSIIENNDIGIKFKRANKKIYCNKICNNITFNLYYDVSSSTLDMTKNFWCTNDSAIISSLIYDGYDNINLGLVNFMPLDTQCYLPAEVGVRETGHRKMEIRIFPNPFSKQTIIETTGLLRNGTLTVVNSFGHTVAQIKNIHGQPFTFNRNNLPGGLYFAHLAQDNQIIATKKLIISD